MKGAGMADKGSSFTVETSADFTDDLSGALRCSATHAPICQLPV